MKNTFFLISICFVVACKSKDHNKIKNIDSVSQIETVNIGSIKKKSDSVIVTSLPLGNSFINFDFPEIVPIVDEDSNKIVNDKTIKIDSILKTANNLIEIKSFDKINSNKEIQGPYSKPYEFSDRSSVFFEKLYKLPSKNGLVFFIEKVSKELNKNNRSKVLYCIGVYQDDKILNRYNIGYVYYGDLVESYKVWYINKDFIISTRIIEGVAGNDETYIGSLNKYIITSTGELLRYFDIENGDFENTEEKGKIKNNTKNGVWIETKYNMYVEEQTYVEASYKEGKPIGKWEYYNIIDETKKGSKILMTEEYSKEGKLLKREITGEN